MAIEQKRLTLVSTSETEKLLDEAKRIFYNRTRSEMIRILITTGLKVTKDNELPSETDLCHDD